MDHVERSAERAVHVDDIILMKPDFAQIPNNGPSHVGLDLLEEVKLVDEGPELVVE